MKTGKVILLIAIGASVGTLAGLLLAPDEGKETRKKIKKAAEKYKKHFQDKASEYKEKVKDIKTNLET